MAPEKYNLPYYSETFEKYSDKLPMYQEFEEKTLDELFEIYKAVTGSQGAVLDHKKHEVVCGVIADKLGLFTRETLEVFFWDEFGSIFKRIDEIEKIAKTHRHPLNKTYGEKPIW